MDRSVTLFLSSHSSSLTLFLSHTLPLSHSSSLTATHTLPLSHSSSLTLLLSHTRSLSLSRSRCLSLAVSPSHTHVDGLSHSLSLFRLNRCLSHSLSLSLTLFGSPPPHTMAHTHLSSLTLFLAHTLPLSHTVSLRSHSMRVRETTSERDNDCPREAISA